MTSCSSRCVAGARSCPAQRPCVAPPRTGIWLARTICSFRPVAMVTGWLEMGFHRRRPGTLGGKSRQEVCLFFSWAEMKGRGRPCPLLPTHTPSHCLVPGLLLVALPSLLSLQFESPRVCPAAAARWAVAAQGCAGRCPAPPSTAAGCCKQGLQCLPLPQPCCCSCLAPIAPVCAVGAPLLTQGTGCCRTPQTGCGPALPHFLPGLVAVSPAAAQAEATHKVLSTRTFRTSAYGLLCAHAQPRHWERDFVFLLAGLWSEPSSPDAKLVVAWEHVGWWASADWQTG